MACTPKQMGDAIVRNLESKTGHPLAYWLDVHREGGAADRKSAIAHLKRAGLGHFQAQKVWEAARGETQERGPGTPFPRYGNPEALVRDLFPGELARGYAAFAEVCLALGDDVSAQPCRTYVPFYASRQFAIVAAAPGGQLRVGLAMPEGYTDAEVGSARGLGGPERINVAFALDASGVPTAAQHRVLADAYAHNR